MSTVQIIRVVGVILIGAYLWHVSGIPWGLVAAAGVACLFLP